MAITLEISQYPADQPDSAAADLERVLTGVAFERYRQDCKWGGAAHDDGHTIDDWWNTLDRLKLELDIAADAGNLLMVRHHLVEIAATAVAAIQSLDRRNPGLADAALDRIETWLAELDEETAGLASEDDFKLPPPPEPSRARTAISARVLSVIRDQFGLAPTVLLDEGRSLADLGMSSCSSARMGRLVSALANEFDSPMLLVLMPQDTVARVIDKVLCSVRYCRVCGCTDNRACHGGCHWAGDDICSACESAQEADLRRVVSDAALYGEG